MTTEGPEIRVGDAERDDAISLLQEHLTIGRLDHAEFDERIAQALQARTRQQLFALFTDLPGRRPGESAPPGLAAPVADPVSHPSFPHDPGRPWFAQWWMLLIAIAVAVMSRGRLGSIVPMTALWIWVVWPYVMRNRATRPATTVPPRALTMQERMAIKGQLALGQKIRAIKLYREYTGAGLADAKKGVEALQRQRGY